MKITILFLVVLFMSTDKIWSQTSEILKGAFNLRFIDQQTGISVKPEYIEIKESESENREASIFMTHVAGNGSVTKRVANGNYDLTVYADGYAPMSSHFVVYDQTLNIIFNLKSRTQLKEQSLEYIRSLRASTRMVILGFVVDDSTGKPFENVYVYATSGAAQTMTDKNGFFKLLIPVNSDRKSSEKGNEIFFEKGNYRTEKRQNFERYANGDITFKVRMKKGSGMNAVDIRSSGNVSESKSNSPVDLQPVLSDLLDEQTQKTASVTCVSSIRVGTNCTGHSCPDADINVLDFDTYTANVLTNEWGQWGAWPNGMNSLNAGAVAIRSYALKRIQSPLNAHGANYDICSTIFCHVYNPSINPSSYATSAINNTAGSILTNSSGNVVLAEFAAETNDNFPGTPQTSGNFWGQCGDGKFQKSVNGPPINGGGCYPTTGVDLVCVGLPYDPNSHPRGMCQRGSVRWATGYTVPNNTTMGTLHGHGTKTWQELLAYYYPYHNLGTFSVSPSYMFKGSGNWDVPSNWSENTIPPSSLPCCSDIIINPIGSSECVLNVPQTILACSKLIIMPGKKFRIAGDFKINAEDTVIIGTQIWKVKNLNVDTFRNGEPIPQVTSLAQWGNLTTPAWCYYNNDPANGDKYGKIYNWYAVNDPRGLAPTGWHVPSLSEWNTVVWYLGGDSDAGGKMKMTGTQRWSPPNIGATNLSGFTGLPGGYRDDDGIFNSVGRDGYWWSSTEESNTDDAWGFNLYYNSSGVDLDYDLKESGYSVRCIRN